MSDYRVLIMAGGSRRDRAPQGHRQLLTVDNVTLIDRIINQSRDVFLTDPVIIVDDYTKPFGSGYRYFVPEARRTPTEALSYTERFWGETTIILQGDVFYPDIAIDLIYLKEFFAFGRGAELYAFNALRACTEALIPIEMSVFSLQGVSRLLKVVEVLKTGYGHDIKYKALATMCDTRTLFAAELLNNIKRYFGVRVYATIIHMTVKLKEAADFGVPITSYDQRCRGAMDYRELGDEVIAEEKRHGKVKTASSVLGPRQTEQGVIFTYYDPVPRDVQLAGDFSDWKPVRSLTIQDGKERILKCVVSLDPGNYQYKYIVDGEWRVDPNNDEVVKDDKGVSNSSLLVS